ncbi:MAG: Bax inhibitor-1 family protein [Verrucomicrobiota bacterium JB022]|nr:Bax inhibitor-1 family protein [Verrucomicrobiota bacterium JB022]
MSHAFNPAGPVFVIDAPAESRAAFIRKTYAHLAAAVLGFILLEVAFFSTGIARSFAAMVLGWGQVGWLGLLGAFMVGGWMASSLAHRTDNKGLQYGGFALYVLLESLIFIPLLFIAMAVVNGSAELILQAGTLTVALFIALSAVVFTTGKDFSFLGSILKVAGLLAIGLIVAGAIFGFDLGLWFSFAMVGLAAGAILYTTSKVMNQYQEDQYVGAALELFAAIALLFWYILRIFIASRR